MQTARRFFSRPRLWGLLCGLTLAVAQLFTPATLGTAQAATTTCTPNGATQSCTVTFSASGAPESWTVPAGVTSATFDLYGAQGGAAGGLGGRVTATLAVTPGASYQARVGAWGSANGIPAGYNGGASVGSRSGGGASDVRSGAFALTDRLLVAGGGGGTSISGSAGGAGGHPNGGNGATGGAGGGGGGSQTAGGAGGLGSRSNGTPGTLGQGGGGAGGFSGGGGGGGYYGGGGGGTLNNLEGGGGGGGSSYGPVGASFENGVRSGDGLVIISYSEPLPDTIAPVANPTQSPAAAPSGWNNSNVTVSWNWSDPATSTGSVSGIDPANCTTSSVSSGSGTINLTATCKDKAGNTGTATYQVKVDPTAPTASPSQSPAANGAGWNNTDVTVNWNWTFTGAEIDTANCTTSLTSSGEGTLTLSATCADVALNQRTVPYTVKVDKTAPVVTVTGVSNGASYTVGSVPTAACSTSDATSGVATPATLSLTGGNGDGTGSFTATCSGATDVAGNSAAAVSVTYTVNPPPDTTAPVITPNVVGALGNNGWYVSDVSLSWSVVDAESTISSQSGCETQNVTSDTDGVTFTCTASSSGGSSSESVTIKRDATAPTISAAASSAPNGNGWYNSDITVYFTCNDNLSGVVSCPTAETLSSEGTAVASTAQTITDAAGNSSAASNIVTVQIDKTAPVVTVTGVSDGANYTLGSVPTAACSTSDGVSGVATQATISLSGGNPDGSGSFTATCSGATDNAGNSAAPVSVSYTVSAPVDVCTTTALRDDFNRANGSLGSNWAGLTGQSFYKIAGNQVDVQLGGPVVWKPTTFGVNQAAFVTLSTLAPLSPSQGVLLKVQSGAIPNAGAIAVVYDSLANAVRVSTLRLNTSTWTSYGNTVATFANGDRLLGCVQADGTVRVYQNNSLLTTVTLNAADQQFFNAKGGKIGMWTVAAPNAFFDDFGGGALDGVSSAALDATIPGEVADDGAEITVAVDYPTDEDATAPNAGALVNQIFLPLVNR
ncbi:MAG: glycine-rich protein [Caldilineaceae bacterium]